MSTVGSALPRDAHIVPERHRWDRAVANVVAGLSWSGYSFSDQTISELSATEAPSRPIGLAFAIPYGLMSIATQVSGRRSSSTQDEGCCSHA
jgi:hypothetical protein